MASYSTDPALYVYTSLTAGSSHIVTATSRLETILRANRIPFKAKDIAVDEKARMLWGRRSGKDANGRKRQIPALVQEGLVLGDIVEIEEWNEYRELKQHLKIYYDETTIPTINHKYPEPQLKKRTVKKSANKEASSSKPAPPPPAPPLPESSASPSAANTATSSASTAAETKIPAKSAPQPSIRSVADEAAQKAKDLRLKKARERVATFKKEDPPSDGAAGAGTTATPAGLDAKDLVREAQIKEGSVRTDMSIDEILNKGLDRVALGEPEAAREVNGAPGGEDDAEGGLDAAGEKRVETTKEAAEPAPTKEPEHHTTMAGEAKDEEPTGAVGARDGVEDKEKKEGTEKGEQEEASPQP